MKEQPQTARWRVIWDIAWHRFGIISSIVSDANARTIALLFYFTILAPFGLISSFFTDPLHHKSSAGWLKRDALPTDIDSAKQQG